MKKIFRYSILILIVSLFLGGSCWGQPRSDYPVTWGSVTDGDTYKVFVWEGADPATCPFVQEQDYLNPDVNTLFVKDATLTGTTVNLLNNGEYVVVAVVAVSSAGIYGGLGKSADVVKLTVPGTPSAINVVLP